MCPPVQFNTTMTQSIARVSPATPPAGRAQVQRRLLVDEGGKTVRREGVITGVPQGSVFGPVMLVGQSVLFGISQCGLLLIPTH